MSRQGVRAAPYVIRGWRSSATAAGTHMQMRGVRKAKDGTYWIVFSGERVVRQVDDTGKVLRTVKPDGINFDHVHGITC